MGITIHFEGRLRDEESLARVIEAAKKFSDTHGWPLAEISEEALVIEKIPEEYDSKHPGFERGIQLQPHESCEPLRLEFDEDLRIQEFTKTQFAPMEIHVLMTRFLHSIEPEFEEIQVVDEGEYFETGDISMLEQHRNRFFDALEGYLAQDDKYYGPVRLPNGRIVDIMERE